MKSEVITARWISAQTKYVFEIQFCALAQEHFGSDSCDLSSLKFEFVHYRRRKRWYFVGPQRKTEKWEGQREETARQHCLTEPNGLSATCILPKDSQLRAERPSLKPLHLIYRCGTRWSTCRFIYITMTMTAVSGDGQILIWVVYGSD